MKKQGKLIENFRESDLQLSNIKMGKIITFYSSTKSSGKTTIIFNTANLLAYKKNKVAILELRYDSDYYNYLNFKNINLKTQNILKHYSFYKLDENLTVIFLNKIFEEKSE